MRRPVAVVTALLAVGACAPRGATAPPPAADALPRTEPAVRVGLRVDTTFVDLSAPRGLVIGEVETGRVVARTSGAEWVRITAASGGGLRLSDGRSAATRAPGAVLVRPRGEGLVQVGDRTYRGEIVVREATPGRVTAINTVELEKYLLGVVPHEIGKVGEDLLEAAKAQAVAARTYAVANRGRRRPLGFDFYATVQDQVYGGSGSEHEVTSRAVRETEGEVLTYRGVPIEAYYHSTCAGRTAAIEEVWNERPRPYLVSVVDVNPETGEAFDVSSSRFRWTARWTAEQLEEILTRTLADSLPAGIDAVGDLRDLRVRQRTPSGRVRALRIETTTASFTVGGDRVRWILRTPEGGLLNSSKFDLRLVRNASGAITEVIAEGGGWGHGIGMCQVGAMGRARAGQNYRSILRTYYPRTELRDLY